MAAPARLNTAQYFPLEELADERHELINGTLYAMAGGTPEHSRVASAITVAVGSQLRGKPCRPVSSDLRVYVKHDTVLYPDVTVICGPVERLPGPGSAVTNPIIVFEVLSPSTAKWDREGKSRLYREIPSLQAIVLVDPERPLVETIERQPDGTWLHRQYISLDDIVPLPAIDATLPLADLYEA